jgi:hypothetical protein
MKKRDYLSPHAWQQSDLHQEALLSNASLRTRLRSHLQKTFRQKNPPKIGRYIALLCLAILLFFLFFHHSHPQKKSLDLAQANTDTPVIQTITLPTAANTVTTPPSTPKTIA